MAAGVPWGRGGGGGPPRLIQRDLVITHQLSLESSNSAMCPGLRTEGLSPSLPCEEFFNSLTDTATCIRAKQQITTANQERAWSSMLLCMRGN